MIAPDFVRTMARYNRWQNGSLYDAADTLDDAARRADRGAFFGSIHGTLSHLLWGDTMWMSRFDGWEKATGVHADSPGWVPDWQDLKARRARADAAIIDWADRIDAATLGRPLRWQSSGATPIVAEQPMALLVTHFFNHQTHHRGQVHAMLTAAGATPDVTDLPRMPGVDA